MADAKEEKIENKLDETAKDIKQEGDELSPKDLKKVSGGAVKDHSV